MERDRAFPGNACDVRVWLLSWVSSRPLYHMLITRFYVWYVTVLYTCVYFHVRMHLCHVQ